jgi:hypothetical protein
LREVLAALDAETAALARVGPLAELRAAARAMDRP